MSGKRRPAPATRDHLRARTGPRPQGQSLGSPGLPELQRLAGNRAIQRYVVLSQQGSHWVPEENRQPPVGQINVFGAARVFDWQRWNRDYEYRRWVFDGWNQPGNAPDARPEPGMVGPQSNAAEINAQLLAQLLYQQQLHAYQMQLAMQAQMLQMQQQQPTQQVQQPPQQVQATPSFVTRAMEDEEGPGVRKELKKWQTYVEQALGENPSGEVLWQLQSSKTVLDTIVQNLNELIDEGEDEHDFDLALGSDGTLQAVIDSTAGKSLRIENLVTNPRNLYTLRGQQAAEVRGAGRSLIAHIVQQADKRGDKVVRLIALSRAHAERYLRQGFQYDQAKLEPGPEEGTLVVPDSEIPMIGAVADLKKRFL